jgi:L-amino acid N-acyltransferase YncA
MKPPLIRPFQPGDEHAIAAIYNHYILHTTVTFEEEALSVEQMRARIDGHRQHHPWLVCERDGEVVGYAYGTKFHARAAFRHTLEASVYLKVGCERQGLGRALYGALIPQLRAQGCHTLVAVIALPHEGSVALHEALGFQACGRLPQVGFKFGQWLDVGHWTLRLSGVPSDNVEETAWTSRSDRQTLTMPPPSVA